MTKQLIINHKIHSGKKFVLGTSAKMGEPISGEIVAIQLKLKGYEVLVDFVWVNVIIANILFLVQVVKVKGILFLSEALSEALLTVVLVLFLQVKHPSYQDVH